MTFWKWSRAAANNGTADSTCPWPEGMAPSQVNDSARGNMAALAKYRDDIAGAIATTGSPNAYSLASYQTFDSLAHMDGAMIAFAPHATNAPIATLNVDGLGAKPLRSAPGIELPAGVLVQGTPYAATYFNASGEWILQGFFGNPYSIPIGGGMVYFGTSAPNSAFVFPFGQAISRTTYAALFGIVGTTYGGGDGSTTFNLPDLRDRVPVGKGDMGGVAAGLIGALVTDAGTIVSTTLGSRGGSATHVQTQAEMANHTHANTLTDSGHSHGINTGAGSGGGFAQASSAGGFPISTGASASGITINNASAGSSSAMAWLQPSIIVNYIMRII
jgi:microcystin-dependent protein